MLCSAKAKRVFVIINKSITTTQGRVMSMQMIELTLILMREEWYKQRRLSVANIEMLKAIARAE